ncbi:Leucine-rich repeat neuronal protein 2 [Habropoda laboriosa]|uniref:Leucine-rich repeat neuronal protein 2 n=2 Tax=Habropoda laboriosa TaxID=597456 RepID=A0A0L7QX79_9HYME|nr:Leucine-rich repeat neuronal protein 2 [Habropoda laboriosa]
MGTIYTTIFIDLNNLEDLNLSKNVLRTFDDSLLEVLPTLLTLNLSYNHIDSVEHRMNKTTTQISTLDLSHNNISNLPKGFSESLSKLQYLDLSFNKILSLENCNLTYLSSLKEIYINNNFLTTLNIQMLSKSLSELYFGYNQITEIPYDLSHIKVLNIEYNKISEIHENLTTNNLQRLNVSGNMLSTFPSILFENLEILDISDNNFTHIPKAICIKNFPLLIQLNVSKNPIQNLTLYSDLQLKSFVANNMSMLQTVDKDTLTNLRAPTKDCINLTISNNNMLSFIHEDALEHMNLCSLDLSNNRLPYVAQHLIAHNDISTTFNINLQGNPFKCNCSLQWMLSDLMPKLYSLQPNLLNNLRCAWPPQISNMRMVHWYGWEDQIFCINASNFNENLTMNVAGILNNKVVTFDSSPGLLIAVGVAMTALVILVIIGIIWTQRISMRKRRINRNFM